jgi:hypothetical protein
MPESLRRADVCGLQGGREGRDQRHRDSEASRSVPAEGGASDVGHRWLRARLQTLLTVTPSFARDCL